MVRNPRALRVFEDNLLKSAPQSSFQNALQVYEAMWKEARALGVVPLADPLEGIENDIELARVLNCLKNSSSE